MKTPQYTQYYKIRSSYTVFYSAFIHQNNVIYKDVELYTFYSAHELLLLLLCVSDGLLPER